MLGALVRKRAVLLLWFAVLIAAGLFAACAEGLTSGAEWTGSRGEGGEAGAPGGKGGDGGSAGADGSGSEASSSASASSASSSSNSSSSSSSASSSSSSSSAASSSSSGGCAGQFDCGDGTCLPLTDECDGLAECTNASDEAGCETGSWTCDPDYEFDFDCDCGCGVFDEACFGESSFDCDYCWCDDFGDCDLVDSDENWRCL